MCAKTLSVGSTFFHSPLGRKARPDGDGLFSFQCAEQEPVKGDPLRRQFSGENWPLTFNEFLHAPPATIRAMVGWGFFPGYGQTKLGWASSQAPPPEIP